MKLQLKSTIIFFISIITCFGIFSFTTVSATDETTFSEVTTSNTIYLKVETYDSRSGVWHFIVTDFLTLEDWRNNREEITDQFEGEAVRNKGLSFLTNSNWHLRSVGPLENTYAAELDREKFVKQFEQLKKSQNHKVTYVNLNR